MRLSGAGPMPRQVVVFGGSSVMPASTISEVTSPAASAAALTSMELQQAVHLDHDLLLAFVVPGVEIHRAALLRDEGAVHRRMRHLRRHLARRQLEVLTDDNDHFEVERCHLDSVYDLP